MFSKLVQAVKTEETSNVIIDGEAVIYWSPLSKIENYEGCLEPFEATVYYGFDNPFGEIDLPNEGNKWGSDGPYYRADLGIVRAEPADDSGGVFGDGVAFTDMAQGGFGNRHSSMVIMRSPMVSPEYEDLEADGFISEQTISGIVRVA